MKPWLNKNSTSPVAVLSAVNSLYVNLTFVDLPATTSSFASTVSSVPYSVTVATLTSLDSTLVSPLPVTVTFKSPVSGALSVDLTLIPVI